MKKCLVPLRFESDALKFFLSKSLGLTLVKNIMDVLFCDKMFAQNQDLKKHERTYTGKKPYACSHCGKIFEENQNLEMHERIQKK